MRIDRVDVYGYDLSYVHGRYVMSGGRVIETLPSTVVRVTTASGIEGFGEVCPLGPAYLPSHGAGARAALGELAPAVLGVEAGNLGAVNAAMDRALLGHGYAKSAIDTACWDAFGCSVGSPVCDLLNDWVNEHIAGHVPRSRNGFGSAPMGPGLGVDVDVAALGEPLFSVTRGDGR